MKKIRMIARVVVIIIALLGNKQIFESRQEISTLELVKIVGLDYVFGENNEDKKENNLNNGEIEDKGENEGFTKELQTQISLVINNSADSSNSAGNQAKNTNTTGLSQILSFKGLTYNTVVMKLQTYIQKSVPGSHIQYFVLGSEILDYDIAKTIDFIARNNEVRLNVRLYTVENQSAEEFLSSAIKSTSKPDDKLESMEETTEFQRQYVPSEIIDILAAEKSGKPYMIPRLKLEQDSNDVKKSVLREDNELEEDTNYFNFNGYTVAFNSKRVIDLNVVQSEMYNVLVNKLNVEPIDIIKDGNIISFGIIRSKCKYKYEFKDSKNKNIPTKLKIEIDFVSNIEEDDDNINLFNNSVIHKYEKEQEKILKEKIEELVEVSLKENVDFIKIEERFKLYYPYKYRKIKDEFKEIIRKMKTEVKTNCNIKRTYDVMMTKKGEGR